MQHGRVGAVLQQIIGGAIVKTYADCKDHVSVVHRHVRFIGAVHPEHAERLTMGGREDPQPH